MRPTIHVAHVNNVLGEFMRVLLTGATGYLGSQIARALLGKGARVTALKRSTSRLDRLHGCEKRIRFFDVDQGGIEKAFAEGTYDLVFHCATNYGRGASTRPEVVEANLLMPLKLLECSARSGVPCFINSDTMLDKRVSHYSLSKKQFVEWLRLYGAELCCTNVEIEHFYGPGDDPSKFVTHVVLSLLKEVPRLDLTLGEQTRDFIYVDDVVDAFLTLIYRDAVPKGFESFQLGTGTSVKVRDFVRLASELTDNGRTLLAFGAVPYRLNEVMDVQVDNARLKELGWTPRFDLAAGLARTIEQERILL